MKKVSRNSKNPDFRVSTSQLLLVDSPFILFEPKKTLVKIHQNPVFLQGSSRRRWQDEDLRPGNLRALGPEHTAESVTRPGGVLWSAVICPGSLDVFVWGRYGEV